jgi:hypothetical protein
MTQKNVVYYFEECMLSVGQIAEKTGLSIEAVKALLITPPVNIPEYMPRQRRAFNDHVKPF